MGLQGALDSDIHTISKRLIAQGVSADVGSLYSAIQKSNSSLKRKPKKVLEASLERVLEFLTVQDSDDSEAEIEKKVALAAPGADLMNKSLRANLTPAPQSTPGTLPAMTDEAPKKRRMANGEPLAKRPKAEKIPSDPPNDISLHDVGGMPDVIKRLIDLMTMPLKRPQSYQNMSLRLPRGILLHGPPGCGKTMVSRAFVGSLKVPFIEILGPSIVSGMSGESERGVRDRFEEAKKNAPCVIFIDELDAIAPKRESSQSQMEKRIVAQLLVSMDELGRDPEKPVMVLAATNRPDSIDPALRRGGRFDTEINIPVPNERTREEVLKAQTRQTPLSKDVDLGQLARMTAGFVGADLADLVCKAGAWEMDRYQKALQKQALDLQPTSEVMDIDTDATTSKESTLVSDFYALIARLDMPDIPEPEGFDDIVVTMAAFLAVLPAIVPSSKREGFATIPDVSWKDVGALDKVREELQMAIVRPITEPELFASHGATAPSGVLLWGPPGCGKTLLAKAVAAESKANFISVKGPELLNKFVGESEAAVRRVFTRARSSVPCVIFFDELDALASRREDSGSEASARVVNTLLTELDGLDDRAGIYVIAATNRPDMIDEAVLRPGRLETPLFVDLPAPDERVEILRTLLRRSKLEVEESDVDTVARDCDGYSGADLGALVREATHCAIRRKAVRAGAQDLYTARKAISPSVEDAERYRRLKKRFGHR